MSNTIKTSYKIDDRKLSKIFPSWVPFFYGILCVLLIPWTILLSYVLPHHYVSHHWDIAWTGFDIFMSILFASTAILAIKKSSYTSISSIMLGTILIIDAWFDVLTAKPGLPQIRSILEAIIIELPLAAVSFWLGHKIFHQTTKNS